MVSLRRKTANRLGNLIGAHLVPKKSAAYWPERFFVERMFARLKPDCVFDVGANEGQYAGQLRSQGYTGLILSFEPNPDAYARLERAAHQDARWHCYPYALGRERGTATFNLMSEDVFSSFRKPLASDSEFQELNQVVRTIDVEIRTLDQVLPELQQALGFQNPFLKMDSQGFDLEVFAGGASVARRFCGLLSEVSVRQIYEGAPDMTESIKTFAAGGFCLAALHSVHAHLPLKIIEFNCYCVRQDLADSDTVD